MKTFKSPRICFRLWSSRVVLICSWIVEIEMTILCMMHGMWRDKKKFIVSHYKIRNSPSGISINKIRLSKNATYFFCFCFIYMLLSGCIEGLVSISLLHVGTPLVITLFRGFRLERFVQRPKCGRLGESNLAPDRYNESLSCISSQSFRCKINQSLPSLVITTLSDRIRMILLLSRSIQKAPTVPVRNWETLGLQLPLM